MALKELHLNSASARTSFHEEAMLQARLSHPNIPPIFSLSLDEKSPLLNLTGQSEENMPQIMVERLIDGENWGSVIDDRDLEKNIETLITVSRAVAYAHKENVIHGDLKPENIMLGKDEDRYNEIYVVDWGLALGLEKYKKDRAKRNGKQDYSRGGTYAYMPPELLSDMDFQISKASDVFMLGGILCRILTGKAPRQDECNFYKPSDMMSIILQNEISEFVIPHGKKVPEELIAIAHKALQRDPAKRYPDAEAFVQALERYRNHLELRKRLDRAEGIQKPYMSELSNSKDSNRDLSADHVYSASKILELIENTNEFRLIRESLEEMNSDEAKKEEGSPSQNNTDLLNRAIRSETISRTFLVESALRSKDYTLASAQLKIADALESSNPQGDPGKK